MGSEAASATSREAARVHIRLLGPLDVAVGDRPVPMTAPKPRALLTGLALHAGRARPAWELVRLLWDDPPPSAPKTLQTYVSDVRDVLATGDGSRGLLRFTPDGYLLDLAPERVDALRFERLLTEGRRAADDNDAEGAAERLRAALQLWRGDRVEALGDTVAAETAATRLDELRWWALETVGELELGQGGAAALVPELRSAVIRRPLRERLWAVLMRALAATGRRADALLAYEQARGTIGRELGIDPSPQLQQLAARIAEGRTRDQVGTGAGERVEPAWPVPGPAAIAPPGWLVGRSRQREILLEAWELAAVGGRAVVAIAGGPGSGRTTLLSWIVEHVRSVGAWVLAVRCQPGVTLPYHPWVELVRWVRSLDSEGSPAPPAEVLSLAEERPAAPPPPSRVGPALAAWLGQPRDRSPVLLTVDDLHLAPPLAAGAFLHLARNALPRSTMLLATTGIVGPDPETMIAVDTLRTEPNVTVAHLPTLTREQIRELIDRRGYSLNGHPGTRAADVHRETAGIPALVAPLLDEMDRRTDASVDVPPSEPPGQLAEGSTHLQDAARRMLRELGSDAEELFDHAAALPAVFTAADLAGRAARPREEIAAFLARARAVGLVERGPRGVSVHPPVLRTALTSSALLRDRGVRW